MCVYVCVYVYVCVCVWCVYSSVQRTIYVTPVARGQHVAGEDIWNEKASFTRNPVSGKAETEGQAILKIYELLVYGNIHQRIIYTHVIHVQYGLFLYKDMISKRPDLDRNMLKSHLIWSDRNTNTQLRRW